MYGNDITDMLKVKYPIIQAPMAGGISTSRLVAAVSNAGALGMIGAGYMDPDQIREQIQEIKQLTTFPFGINLFVPEKININEEEIHEAYGALGTFREQLHVESNPPPIYVENTFEASLRVVLEEGVAVCSFTFGLPTMKQITQLQNYGIIVLGTATTVEEAKAVEAAGMDGVVVQGYEAGGHRGNFLGEAHNSLIGLMSLIPQVVDNVNIPVIAAGGIMDARGVRASTCLGASGVQMGTAFLTCVESGAHEEHKKAILGAAENDIVLTKTFSGKYARGVNNEFIIRMGEMNPAIAPYPIQNTLTQDIRRKAAKHNNPAFMSLWSGQSPRLSRNETVKELIERVVQNNNPPS